MQKKNALGSLYVVATPIGNLGDITLRAINILKSVERIIAEDTRHAQHLLKHYDIKKPLLSLHQFNEQKREEIIISYLMKGEDLALISDAGTPLISDPGFALVKTIRKLGGTIIPIPGPSALITALCASGMPTTEFYFGGFFPAKTKERQLLLHTHIEQTGTLIFYEAPHRILATLQDLASMMKERQIVIARELTKIYEEFISGKANDILEYFEQFPQKVRGEMVILIEGAVKTPKSDKEKEKILKILLDELPTKQAVNLAAKMTGGSKKLLYQLALQYKDQ